MANYRWIKTGVQGLRYREHPTRKHGIKKDRFYQFKHYVPGVVSNKTGKPVQSAESFGWLSDGWTLEKCTTYIHKVKENKKTGQGPQSLEELRKLEELKKYKEQVQAEAEKAEQEKLKSQLITFDEVWATYYENDPGKKPNSWENERLMHKKWIGPVLGEKPLKDIQKMDLQKLKKRMKDQGKADRTAEYALAVVRQVYNFAIDNGLYSGVAPKINKKSKVMPKFDNKVVRYLTREEADKLFPALKAKSRDVHDMALVSLYAGLRFGEVAGLTWNDVSLDSEKIFVMDTKGKTDRIVPMHQVLKDMFKRRIPGDKHKLIFPRGKDGQKQRGPSITFDRTVDDLKLNEGVTERKHRLTFHGLRHSFASWLVTAGTSIYEVKELLGHSDIRLTERYAHLNDGALKNAVNGLEAIKEPKQAKVTHISAAG